MAGRYLRAAGITPPPNVPAVETPVVETEKKDDPEDKKEDPAVEIGLVKNIRGQVLGSEVCQAYDIARFSAYPLS